MVLLASFGGALQCKGDPASGRGAQPGMREEERTKEGLFGCHGRAALAAREGWSGHRGLVNSGQRAPGPLLSGDKTFSPVPWLLRRGSRGSWLERDLERDP